MGLYSILKKIKQEEREVRLLILGLDNAGKTTILKRITGEDVTSISPTLGFNIKTVQHRNYNLNFWDVGGQTSLRAYWRNYFETTDALIWVVDSVDRLRLGDCRAELAKLLVEERLLGATLLIIANKQDVTDAMSADEIATRLDLSSIKSHHWRIFACSAVTGDSVMDAIDWVLDDVASRIFSLQ